MNIEPLFDNLLITVEEKQETTESGLVIPDNASFDRPQKGTVVSHGSECKVVRSGDKILFKKYSPDEVKIDDVTVYLLKEEDVLAKVL